jgi:hypothetical protein
VHELLEAGTSSEDETRQKMAELQKAGTAKIVKLLTEAQKSKWMELRGELFNGEIHFDLPVIIRND